MWGGAGATFLAREASQMVGRVRFLLTGHRRNTLRRAPATRLRAGVRFFGPTAYAAARQLSRVDPPTPRAEGSRDRNGSLVTMPDRTYTSHAGGDRPIVWLRGEVRTPPFSSAARREVGLLLRRLQRGEKFGLPHSRPLPSLGRKCHELRIIDAQAIWRVIYRLDPDALIVVAVFSKKTQKTPANILDACNDRLNRYDATMEET